MTEGEQEHLSSLERELYTRESTPELLRRSALQGLEESGQSDWPRVEPIEHRWWRFLSPHWLKKILWLAAGFFLLTAAITVFVFYRGNNLISSGNVEVVTSGPTTIAAGQELSLQVSVTNKNKVALELVDLIVEYPPGTRVAGTVDKALTRERLPLGKIDPGKTVNRLVRAVLFGEKGNRKTLNLTIEYRLANSSAIFDRNASFEVEIGSTPLVLIMDVPSEVTSSQEILIDTQIQSNAESLITNPVVVATYPAGFRFGRATPPPTHGQNVWQLASLKPGAKTRIQIHGTLEGQDEDQKSFHLSAGTVSDKDITELAATYGSVFSTVIIKRPFVSLSATVNGNAATDYVADSREPLRIDIDWVNNLPTEVVDGEILATISGQALDKLSVSVNHGFYNSGANSVLWTKTTEDTLGRVAPGASGRVSFSFSSLSLVGADGSSLRQPELGLSFKFRGRRVNEGGATDEINSVLQKKIKLNSMAQLAGKVLARTGSFTNHGPVPPRVDQETSYTIVWSVLNSSNNLEGGKVTATLPPYVKWLGVSQPSAETLNFQKTDSGGGELVWDLGLVTPGTGTQSPAREVAFQVALTPSLSQVGEAPVLVTDPTFSGLDTFTKEILTAKLKRPLDTAFVSEAQFKLGDDRVTR